ncbi:UDP-N-acetylmuramate dehydrogenase [Synechococcus sp. CC9605]|uniref:UDP-N-acetylenolpyruvoylglucosamine reductase n=1 Tax=Synechococcus sp. (strain CC9605) TaxID=110662 RepID=MURB_SYNSC|nr:UDP-N-acetylmuramate dehydrogenase [Synechococcus sp. CC9605]Q3ANM5.1 RecName: Full=UDP-N-acetylenolpyruvoylglucosamine reductase; AltName: Full=UDP-N-acetylmuramate dehydrogenase [Synechococcus sp. CC9605]ABB33807.1 UDP-N-acetylenolpyruvoylglucosamine reductase [Synechococcus sp. CC9605]
MTQCDARLPQGGVKLADYTTWRVGGAAEWLAEPASLDETQAWIEWAAHQGMPCRVIGAGSNLLIHDDGLPGLSLCLRKLQGLQLDATTGTVEVLAGEPIPSLARRAARAGLHGLEWSIGIPGTAGGAAVMNAGAQGGCTAEWLESVRVVPLEGGNCFELQRHQLDFAYRHSRLQEDNLVVLSARFRLQPGHDPDELKRVTTANLSHRTTTQPYQQPSCGSVFRNPEPLKAGRLIEEQGLKGTRIGGAEISTVHANFIVNTGDAQAKDIAQLIHLVQDRIEAKHGIRLHTEVKRLGFASAA